MSDYNCAIKFNIDFIFVYGYSQFISWNNYFSAKSDVCCIENLCIENND